MISIQVIRNMTVGTEQMNLIAVTIIFITIKIEKIFSLEKDLIHSLI